MSPVSRIFRQALITGPKIIALKGEFLTMKKRFFSIIFALLLTIGLFAGCAAPAELSDDAGSVPEDTYTSVNEGEGTEALDPDGSYTSKEDVSLYLYTYGELPDNFITKKEAKKLGWQGGSLEDYAPGKCIGGDHFGNYEGTLPEDEDYHECDIDTLGKDSRGAKRLVYSDDNIYYTEDHYKTFELIYGDE